MAGERWIFTKPQLLETPSRKCGVDIDKELSYRQQAANLIQEMGQRLQTNQLCINTAIVYMHRFYMFHSFTKFNRNVMSPACLFLAAKVEEQPRKLEHVIKTAHSCLREGSLDTKSETYLEYAQELIINENILLQTLGFEVRVDHPHTTVVTTCQLVRASKDLAQTSYFLATNSLHLTTMCLQQKPNVVACVCIHLACKWSGYEIPSSHEGKLWFNYVDKNISLDLLEELTQDFLNILDKCPSRLKKKIMTWRSGKNGDETGKGDAGQSTSKGGSDSSKSKTESSHSRNVFEDSSAIINEVKGNSERSQHTASTASSSGSSRSTDSKSHSGHPPLNIKDYKQHKEYKERKEKERMAGYSSHTSVKPHGNGDVKRSHQGQGRVDPERKATQHAFDSLHHMSREDAKRHETKREHDSPLKLTIKPDKSRSHEMSSKAVKRSHQSDNETSDGSERHSKHRRSETHPISNDNFPAGTINHSDLFSGQNYPPSSNKLDSGNGNSGSERHSKNRTSYSEGGSNSDRAMWNSGKSSTKSPGSSSAKSSNSSRKDRSIFSPPQHLTPHPPPPPHMIQNKLGLNPGGPPPPPPHVLTKGNMNASFDQSYQRSHPPNYGHAQYPNPNMMGNTYQDSQHSAVQGMNSNGGSMPGANQQEVIGDLQSQIQNLINHQKYQIAQQQAQSQQPSIFDIDLLDSDLGMPPLPPPLPQNNAPQPPPPPY